MRHTVVLSDLHLSEAVPGDGLWMRYRQRRFFPDDDVAALLAQLCARAGDGAIELVFNGDVFDFDVPPVVAGRVLHLHRPRTEHASAQRLERILDDHPTFLDAVARFLLAGHRAVFVSGNHDAELTFPAVRAALRERLLARCRALGGARAARGGDPGERVLFRGWFHRTADGIHVEHGNQYDRFCSVRYPMEPFTDEGDAIQPTVGSLAVRHMVGRMGYMNPNVDSTFTLSTWGYLRHWFRYYLFTRRSLAVTWALGAVRVALDAFSSPGRPSSDRARRSVEACAHETGAEPDAVHSHAALFAPPALHQTARILCLDRLALVGLGLAAVGLACAHRVAGAAFGLGALGAVLAFDLAVPDPGLHGVYDHVGRCAREIVRLHGARAVVFGHTHHPHGVWEDGTFYGNSGSWSPQFRDVACTVPVERGRPLIWLRTDARGTMHGGLYRFVDGGVLRAEDVGAAAPRALEARRDMVG